MLQSIFDYKREDKLPCQRFSTHLIPPMEPIIDWPTSERMSSAPDHAAIGKLVAPSQRRGQLASEEHVIDGEVWVTYPRAAELLGMSYSDAQHAAYLNRWRRRRHPLGYGLTKVLLKSDVLASPKRKRYLCVRGSGA